MNTIIAILFLAGNLYAIYLFRTWLSETLDYKRARKADIKRRLQVEAKADAAWNDKFQEAENNSERIRFELQANRERHERMMRYLLQDILERYE